MNPVVMAENRTATHDTLFERMFTPKDRPAPYVEVHRGLTNPHIFTIDEQTLWNASLEHPGYSNERVRILSPEDTLLHLATHAFRDLNFCSHNLLDVHEIICQQEIDTDLLCERARAWGATRVLYYLLHNAKVLMHTPVPPELLSRLEPGRITNRINKKILQSSSLQDSSKTPGYRLTQLAAQMAFPDKLSNAVKFQTHYAATRIRDLFSR